VVDVPALEVGSALGQLPEQREGVAVRDRPVGVEVGLEVAASRDRYPPEQNSRKK
jgi:hypothetical protein